MDERNSPGQEAAATPPPPGAVSRRAALTALGGVGLGVVGIASAGVAAAGATAGFTSAAEAVAPQAACVLAPELTEGPYYLDLEQVRRDITEGKPGVPLLLRATIVNATSCAPIANAALDIWHCDAVGSYSGFGTGGANTTFLRGVQLSGQDGVAELATVYPGWYVGRAIHIHLKVHIGGSVSGTTYTGGHVSHTGQFFFDESITQQIAAVAPYNTNSGPRTPLDQDGIYRQGGSAGLLTLAPLTAGGSYTSGVLATIVVGVNPDATPPGS